ncbi:MAG TPA: hypothetical protein VJR58_20950 [Vineibacter sp.]|nr:hypothetical protein [Vineibacter sp.]
MEELILIATPIAAVLAAGFVWNKTRQRLGNVPAGLLSLVAAAVVGSAIALSGHFARIALTHASDDYAWDQIRAGLQKADVGIAAFFEADPVLEQAFRQGIVPLYRQYRNDPDRLRAASEQFGASLFRTIIAPKAMHGSAESVLEWGQAQTAYLKELAAISKQYCGEVAIGSNASLAKIGKRIAPALNRVLAATVSAYKSSDPKNLMPTDSDMEPVWKEVFLGAGTPFTPDDVAAFEQIMTIPAERACDLTLAFMARVLALPAGERTMTLRWVLREVGKG